LLGEGVTLTSHENRPMETIRRATPDDLETLVRLRMEMWREFPEALQNADMALLEASTREYLHQKTASGDLAFWVVEDAAGQIIATGALSFPPHLPTPWNPSGLRAHVIGMYTLPERRSAGIASRLLAHLLDQARARGAVSATLYTSDSGRPLYEQAGFTQSERTLELKL